MAKNTDIIASNCRLGGAVLVGYGRSRDKRLGRLQMLISQTLTSSAWILFLFYFATDDDFTNTNIVSMILFFFAFGSNADFAHINSILTFLFPFGSTAKIKGIVVIENSFTCHILFSKDSGVEKVPKWIMTAFVDLRKLAVSCLRQILVCTTSDFALSVTTIDGLLVFQHCR